MLQVTGHAGGVPKATLERGRSVSFPFSGNIGYIRNLRRFSALTESKQLETWNVFIKIIYAQLSFQARVTTKKLIVIDKYNKMNTN